ncbi:MAG: hypothetical protein WBA76_20150 [Phormidesmis sp.]
MGKNSAFIATILGIFLLAFMGIRSAANWLAQSEEGSTTPNTLVPVSNNQPDSDGALTRSQNDSFISQSGSQTGGQTNDSNGSTDGSQAGSDQTALTPSPTDEAGSLLQRQKSAERDAAVADTQVDIIPTASSDGVAAQGNTTVTPQPTSPAPSTTTPQPTPSPAVPALW